MRCNFCRQNIADGVPICPICGRTQPTPEELSRIPLTTIIAVAASIAVLVAWHYFFPKP
jgi:RNA polymerase subunit RPABC4/transcription elongation factor Spt4